VTSQDVVLVGSYDLRVVALSIAIAVLGAYAGLDLAERVSAARGRARIAWLMGGVTGTAIGIWSMHFTGMLAFHLPVPAQYDWPTALLAFLSACFASLVALVVVAQKQMGPRRQFVGSLFMGTGISGLHYIAMASMWGPAMHHYAPAIVTLSIIFAVGFSFLSLRLAFFFRGGDRGVKGRRVASIFLLGAAICVMHYAGMAAVTFTASAVPPDPTGDRKVVAVLSADGKTPYGMFFSLPAERFEPASAPEVRFMETAAGMPAAIKAWWYPGERMGYEFMYPKDQALRLAQGGSQPVLTTQAHTTATASK
jgi:NO-binding membrane sensor protein with MHYT domain